MDPIAHTLTGGVLAAAGLGRVTPLATAALLIGANAPDVDILVSFAGDYASLAHRRGWTHGVLALVVLPFLVTFALLAYDRWAAGGSRERARAGPLLAIAAVAVLSHPTLDWLNNYGLRWLMPFDGRWFYGDALFIVDPWLWLAFGGVLFLAHSKSRASITAWYAFGLLASALVLITDVPAAARAIWISGVVAFAAVRAAAGPASLKPLALERTARVALGLVGAYIIVAVLANVPARAEVRAVLERAGIENIESIMIGPTPADPFAADVVAETPDAYYTGTWHWLGNPRFAPGAPVRKQAAGSIVEAASAVPEARRYLVWSRFPYFEIETDARGEHIVRIEDARYTGNGRLAGVVVRLDSNLEPVPAPTSARGGAD